MPRLIRETGYPLHTKMFENPSNPWSAWAHLLSTPVVLVPFWTRSWERAAPSSVCGCC